MNDLKDKKFERIQVVSYSHSDKFRRAVWNCICECGNEKKIVGSELVRGHTKSCGCIKKELDKIKQKSILTPLAQGNKNRRLSFGESSMNRVYSLYKQSASRRKHSFEISKQEFKDITKRNCYLCNRTPSNKMDNKGEYGHYYYNGIDRVDNTMGYINSNCQACCGDCNNMKKDKNIIDFIGFVEKVYNNKNKKQKSFLTKEFNLENFDPPQIKSNMLSLFNSYKNSAKTRGLQFNLSRNELFELTQGNCYLCGSLPACECNYKHKEKNTSYIYNGIDRVNPKIGYVYKNCESCCKTCNYAKMTMSKNDYEQKRVYKLNKLNTLKN